MNKNKRTNETLNSPNSKILVKSKAILHIRIFCISLAVIAILFGAAAVTLFNMPDMGTELPLLIGCFFFGPSALLLYYALGPLKQKIDVTLDSKKIYGTIGLNSQQKYKEIYIRDIERLHIKRNCLGVDDGKKTYYYYDVSNIKEFWLTLNELLDYKTDFKILVDKSFHYSYTKKEEQRIEDVIKIRQAIEFYNECKKKDILDLSSEKNQQRANLILEKYSLLSPEEPIQQYFKIAEKKLKVLKKNERDSELAKIRKEEIQEAEESIKYAEFFGRDKQIAMLTDELNECLDMIKSMEAVSYALMCGSQRDTIPEKDWATVGGIVSGLAGGAAGLSATLNVQAQNAQIRAQNEQIQAENKERMKQSFLLGEKMKKELNIDSYKRKAKNLEEKIENAKIKLVCEKKATDVIKNVRFENEEIHLTETGAIRISVQASTKNLINIFDDSTFAYIDGTIRAEVFQENSKIGEALLVLPLRGIRHCEPGNGTLLKGILITNAERGKEYTVKYSPYKLWEIET